MKRIFFFAGIIACCNVNAQEISQAVITAKTSMTLPEDMELPAGVSAGEGGGDRVMMINGMGGGDDNKSTTWFKGDKVKIVNETGFGRNTIIIDKTKKTTTTLIEAMGTKRGFFTTEADELTQEKNGSLMGVDPKKYSMPVTTIEELADTKKIAGYECKKALIKNLRQDGKTDSVYVWYAPELKMGEGFSFGSSAGMGTRGLDKLNGFPMSYEVKMRRGMKMNIEVTKVDLKKTIDDKEFEVPKDFEIKPMGEMQIGGDAMQRIEMRIQR